MQDMDGIEFIDTVTRKNSNNDPTPDKYFVAAMKNILLTFTSLLSLNAFGQMQAGQTCLFTCMHHVDPRKSVEKYIHDFSLFEHTKQDVFHNGAMGTLQEIVQFIKSEFDTIDLAKTGVIGAIDSGYVVFALVQEESDLLHAIVIHRYYSIDPKNDRFTKLIYYDPATGSDDEHVRLKDFLLDWQLYSVGVKHRTDVLVSTTSGGNHPVIPAQTNEK
jgi:hypothetical protein